MFEKVEPSGAGDPPPPVSSAPRKSRAASRGGFFAPSSAYARAAGEHAIGATYVAFERDRVIKAHILTL